jgi:hypothetical protein
VLLLLLVLLFEFELEGKDGICLGDVGDVEEERLD